MVLWFCMKERKIANWKKCCTKQRRSLGFLPFEYQIRFGVICWLNTGLTLPPEPAKFTFIRVPIRKLLCWWWPPNQAYQSPNRQKCCSTRFRSWDLWVMSPTRFLCATEQFTIWDAKFCVIACLFFATQFLHICKSVKTQIMFEIHWAKINCSWPHQTS